MIIAFPVQTDEGLMSQVYGHFGTAPMFIKVETDTDELAVVVNQDLGHAHGQCQPLNIFGGAPLDAVVVGNIGAGALRKLSGAGIKALRGVEGTVKDNLELAKSGRLPEVRSDQTCSGTDCHH